MYLAPPTLRRVFPPTTSTFTFTTNTLRMSSLTVLKQLINTDDANGLDLNLATRDTISQSELDECLESAMPGASIDIIRLLLQHGARLTILSFGKAIGRQDPAVFQLLLDHGWDINSTEFGRSAVQ